MDYRVIILYPHAFMCGASIVRKTIDTVFSAPNGTNYHLMTIAFNTDNAIYIPRFLFLLRFGLMGEKYSQAEHECLTWSSWCMWLQETLPHKQEVPDFFLDVLEQQAYFRPQKENCFCYAGPLEDYQEMAEIMRAEMR